MIDELSRPMLSFGWASMEMESLIINLTPCSTAPSSLTGECEEVDSYFDCEPTTLPQIWKNIGSPACSAVQDMVASLKTMYQSNAPRDLIIDREDNLAKHLYHTSVTLADVEALVPAMSRKRKLANKICTNIGLYHARTLITDPDLEAMLTHIFTRDDHRYSLFSRTKAQIERFEREAAENNMRQLSQRQRQIKLQHENTRRKQQAAKVRREAEYIRRSIPPRYCKPSGLGFLPEGYSSIADIITNVDGMN